MADQPIQVLSSDLGRLAYAMRDRDEVLIVEFRDGEPRHGIATASGDPISVSWLPTGKLPAGGVEIAEHLTGQERAQTIADAEGRISRHIFPGEEPSDEPIVTAR